MLHSIVGGDRDSGSCLSGPRYLLISKKNYAFDQHAMIVVISICTLGHTDQDAAKQRVLDLLASIRAYEMTTHRPSKYDTIYGIYKDMLIVLHTSDTDLCVMDMLVSPTKADLALPMYSTTSKTKNAHACSLTLTGASGLVYRYNILASGELCGVP